MPSVFWADAEAELEAAYALVPNVHCKGICTDACGPIWGGPLELLRMREAGVKLPPLRHAVEEMVASDFNYACPALVDGRCSTYSARPAICRVWAASEDLPCPHGCEVDGKLLSRAETEHIIDVGRKAGTTAEPSSVEQLEEEFANAPGADEYFAANRPTATWKTPMGRRSGA